jgi:hypothetical protein
MFHPFEYQYQTRYLRDEEGDMALLELQSGAKSVQTRLPKSLLPKEVQPGDSFSLCMQPKECLRNKEERTMKELLGELLR